MLLDFDPTDDQAGFKILEQLTSDAGRMQEEVLKEIVSQNANTEYLRDFDILLGHHHKQAFKTKVPIVSYEDIKPIIERIANGEPSHIISSQLITELLTSSGTSGGQPKLMPSTAQELNRKTFFYNLLIPVMNKYIAGLDKGKAMYLLFTKPEMTTPSGLKARPVLTSYYHSSHFKNRPFNPYNVYTSPDATILCSDSKQSMFCQLLCGLVNRHDVLRVGAVFASALLRAIKFLEDHHQEFINNIRSGHLSEWVTDPGCREVMASDALTRPDPDAAAAIEAECRSSSYSWEGIIKRLWPRTKYVEVIVTGSMAQYIPTLEFYCGGLPLVSTMYGSSECYFGINLRPLSKPKDVSYTLLPNMAYFEFIPVEKDHVILDGCGNNHHAHDDPVDRLATQTVDLVDVKIGRYYELVVTTYTGLYRYKVGDILKVTGFYNNAPEFQFVQRRNVVLSIDTDKTNEEDLLNAVARAKLIVEPLGFLLAEYTAYADTSSVPGHYVLFWELIQLVNFNHEKNGLGPGPVGRGFAIEASIMEKCCATIEESLDSVYRRCRKKDGSIGPLEIRVVGKGGFDALMDYCLSQGSSVNQYKTPRCIKSEEAIRILDSRIVGSFFSRDAPSWEPKFNYLNN
ncbi:indole-3-acetic acid-amido synthetase GH3.17-like [Impatiens glandulifera]|uniref:indole-3-acetic acid-amido synthetase GH3.17-like n=1 Tax=Impatiens glandulifera TaxID=253017 RepID=UPI001FB13873|nr:indole-3-acetic acid-amido synthetase GH3.17-like [Impatiens glandulifera]